MFNATIGNQSIQDNKIEEKEYYTFKKDDKNPFDLREDSQQSGDYEKRR